VGREQKREPMTTNDDKKVEQLIGEFNRAWTDGRLDDLPVFFDERVVAIAPNGGRMEGREAMVESFRQFLAMAKVDDFRVTSGGVHVFDSAAAARFGFVVRYEINGASYDETGSEVLALQLKVAPEPPCRGLKKRPDQSSVDLGLCHFNCSTRNESYGNLS
jgi:hypothetical protein